MTGISMQLAFALQGLIVRVVDTPLQGVSSEQ